MGHAFVIGEEYRICGDLIPGGVVAVLEGVDEFDRLIFRNDLYPIAVRVADVFAGLMVVERCEAPGGGG